ncbi:MAG: DNRLRE domain-containing protein [Fibrobacterota bacterium]
MNKSCLLTALFLLLFSAVNSYELPEIDAQTKANLRSMYRRGASLGREEGKLGQWGNSITNSMAYLGTLAQWGCGGKTTCETYHEILLWMKASETSEGSGIVGGNHDTPLAEKGGGHCCQSGWTIEDGLNCVGNIIPQDNPSWSLAMYGTNDVNGNGWDAARGEKFKSRLKKFLKSSINAGIVTAVSSIPPRRDHDESVAICNNMITGCAAELGIPLVDYYAAATEFHPTDWDGTTISDDGVHPSWSGGRGDFDPPEIQDYGYSIRTKLTLDYAKKLKRIVFENGAPDGEDLPILAVSSSTHEYGSRSSSASASFSWILDGGSTPTEYSWEFDKSSTTTPDETSEGTTASASVTASDTGTWFFHVRANSSLGWGPVSRYAVRIIPENQIILQEGMDGYSGTADANIHGEYNYGGSALEKKYNGNSSRDRLLYRFDLTPALGANVTSAFFRLFVENPGDGDTVAAYKLTNSWEEGEGGYQSKSGVTWDYRFADDTSPWNTPGGDFEPEILDGAKVPPVGTQGWIELDITSTVQEWLADTSSNHGIILEGYKSWKSSEVCQREFPLKTLRPMLVINYSSFSEIETAKRLSETTISAPFPNPGNPGVNIPITLMPVSEVTVGIYNVKGKLLREFNAKNRKPVKRVKTLSWDGLDKNGRTLPAGVYIAGIKGGNTKKAKKFILAK